MKLLISIIVLGFLCACTSTIKNEVKTMKVTSISFSGSNPSMGPHNSPSKKTIDMGKYQNEANKLLDETQVNGKVSLRKYLELRISNNSSELEVIHKAYDPGQLNLGERIIDLEIDIEGAGTVTLLDLRYFNLVGVGYNEFKELMSKNGRVHKSSSISDMERIIDPSTDDQIKPTTPPKRSTSN